MALKQFRQQQGMVLIFTLVLLLLVTLTSASQIQQNRLQLMMTAVLQQQNQRFADAERALQLAKTYIESQRFVYQRTSPEWQIPNNQYTCKTKDLVFTQFPAPSTTITAGMQMTGLPFSIGDKLTGITLDNGSTVNITKVACLSMASREEDCSINTTGQCFSTDLSSCTTEIYTIESRMRDATGNERTVQSRYALRCDRGLDVP